MAVRDYEGLSNLIYRQAELRRIGFDRDPIAARTALEHMPHRGRIVKASYTDYLGEPADDIRVTIRYADGAQVSALLTDVRLFETVDPEIAALRTEVARLRAEVAQLKAAQGSN